MYHIKATFKPPKEIRGGIPICFPQVCVKLLFFSIQLISFNFVMESASYLQFSDFGSLEKHGFARNRMWSIDTNPPPPTTNSPSRAAIDLILKPSKEDLKIFPHRYISKSFNGLSLHRDCILKCYIWVDFQFRVPVDSIRILMQCTCLMKFFMIFNRSKKNYSLLLIDNVFYASTVMQVI